MNKTKSNKQKVSVIGLGYVGLPLACLCDQKGYQTFAIDIDEEKIEKLKKEISPIQDAELEKQVKTAAFEATSDLSVVKDSEIVIICVPTPIDKNNDPDLRPIKAACVSVKEYLRKDQLVVIESTVNPGVCEEIVRPILEESGLVAGTDFDIAHCPERIDPGNTKWTLENIPRVVGASSQKGLEKTLEFYRSILTSEVRAMKSIKAAEATKIIENTFRDINIAFVNELAKSFDKMGIDLLEVIEGAATKPFSFMPHYPGCGIGGHCIPVDPYYLIKRARQKGFDHKFLKLAREINNSMPEHTIDLLITALNNAEKSVKGTNIGVLGLAYKPNVDDTRESPAYIIVKLLKELGANVHTFDPFVLEESSSKTLDDLLAKSEAVLLVTAHKEFVDMNLDLLKQKEIKVVIDGRNCLEKEKIEDLGIIYKGIGR